MRNKNGQVTIFVIIAIVAIAAIAAFFFLRNTIMQGEIPASIEPVRNSLLSCIESSVLAGIGILESQGGYIELPEFEAGSFYSPFSSQLDFFGNPIPYWYYVSGNNIQKEQVPTLKDMEGQLSDYVNQEASRCNFQDYHNEGFEIHLGDSETAADITENQVRISVSMDMDISRGNETAIIRKHDVSVNSNLGKLYNSARKIYDYEQETLFLEQYGIDTLRLYAPVDGVEVTCSPLAWNSNDVFSELQDAIEANTGAIRASGGEFTLQRSEDRYFVKDLGIEGDVRFLNSKAWPYSFEVNPSEGDLLISRPVGNQQGLGILGFCYVPYHYVYSMKYPVLVQIFDNNEIFQFPLAVVIEGNNPRNALNATAVEFDLPELCEQRNTEATVNVYDTKLNPVEAEVSYECFGTKCDIGTTNSGTLKSEFPQCANGDVIANARGYREARKQYSTISEGSVEVIVDRLYNTTIGLKLDNSNYNKDAMISFISEGDTKTIMYPAQKTAELSQGQYEIQVYIYRNSSLTLGATKTEQCLEIPQSGLGGFFGFTKESCYTIEFPSQVISNALAGGGKQNYYFLESQISGNKTIEISAKSLPTPTSITQLQNNYLLFEDRRLDISFK
jgi:hypothetical protein